MKNPAPAPFWTLALQHTHTQAHNQHFTHLDVHFSSAHIALHLSTRTAQWVGWEREEWLKLMLQPPPPVWHFISVIVVRPTLHLR